MTPTQYTVWRKNFHRIKFSRISRVDSTRENKDREIFTFDTIRFAKIKPRKSLFSQFAKILSRENFAPYGMFD